MPLVGFVVVDSSPVALTYGAQEDMEAWKALMLTRDPSTSLYQSKDGDDLNRCLVDAPYFASLVGAPS